MALCLTACHEPVAEEVAKSTLQEALEALNREDFDAYLQHVDWGVQMDSVQALCMRDVLRQHLGWRKARRAGVASIDMIGTQMEGDSICTVYCQYTFADSTKEVVSQKMVRAGGVWKIRLRN